MTTSKHILYSFSYFQVKYTKFSVQKLDLLSIVYDVMYTDFMYTDFIKTLLNSEYSPYTSKASFKKLIKKQLLDLQGAGDEQEWEGNNFKLTAIAGLRRSERIRTQNLNDSIPCEIN